jgi:DNA-binding NtrC family response regulator
MTTWIRSATNGRSETADVVKTVLAGLASDPQPAVPTPSDVGLIVFDTVSEAALDLVRTSSRDGLVRILAIGTSPDAIDDLGPWPLLDAGASDVLVHTDAHELVDQVAARLSRWEEVDDLARSPLVQEALAGRSLAWTSLLRQIVEVGRFSDASVLVVGEIGTGKDVVARLIHELDPRPFRGELVTIDCRTLDPALAGVELFGREPGTLEGSDTHVAGTTGLGALGVPDGGTLFLDEVSTLPNALRAGLLRAVEDRSHRSAGDGDWRESNIRLICSSSDDAGTADSAPAADDFSQRIAAWRCHLPPLRERREDIPTIAEQLVRRLRPDLEDVALDPALSDFLASRDYPANVHDLLTLVRGICVRHVGPGAVTVGAIPSDELERVGPRDHAWSGQDLERAIGRAVDAGASLKAIGEAARDTAVRLAMAREDGDLRRAARRLRTTAKTVGSRTAGLRSEAEGVEAAVREPSSVVEVPESALLGAVDEPAVEGGARQRAAARAQRRRQDSNL